MSEAPKVIWLQRPNHDPQNECDDWEVTWCVDRQNDDDTCYKKASAKVSELADMILTLRARLEAAEKDAERYRWLRTRIEIRNEQAVSGSVRPALSVALGMAFLDCKTQRSKPYFTEQANKLDAAIDTELAKEGEKK